MVWGGDVGFKKNNTVMQFLLLFSSECFMLSSIKLILFFLFCVGVKFGMLCQEQKTDRGFVIAVWFGEYLMLEGSRNRGMWKIL